MPVHRPAVAAALHYLHQPWYDLSSTSVRCLLRIPSHLVQWGLHDSHQQACEMPGTARAAGILVSASSLMCPFCKQPAPGLFTDAPTGPRPLECIQKHVRVIVPGGLHLEGLGRQRLSGQAPGCPGGPQGSDSAAQKCQHPEPGRGCCRPLCPEIAVPELGLHPGSVAQVAMCKVQNGLWRAPLSTPSGPQPAAHCGCLSRGYASCRRDAQPLAHTGIQGMLPLGCLS